MSMNNFADKSQLAQQKLIQLLETGKNIVLLSISNNKWILLELLQINPNMTRSELALQLSKSENTIKEHLAKLKPEGRLKRIGSDRSGYWMVVS